MATDVNETVNPRHGIDEAFASGNLSAASDEELERLLVAICSGGIRNRAVHPREIVRGITINHI
jgi:hypothetical protein